MKLGIKHLVECHCTLPLYKGMQDIIYHKILVYSKFNSNEKIVEKIVNCENCGLIHKVFDICRSNIVKDGNEENNSSVTIEELELEIPDKLINILRNNNCTIPIYEEIIDALDHNVNDHNIIIKRDLIEGIYHVKILNIKKQKFKILSEKIENEFTIN